MFWNLQAAEAIKFEFLLCILPLVNIICFLLSKISIHTVHDWTATPTHQLTVYLQLYSSRSPEYSAPKKWVLSLALIRPSGTRLDTTQDHSSPAVLECGPRRYLLSRGVQAVPVNVGAPDGRVARDIDLQCYGAALDDSHCAVHSNHRRVA